MQQDPIEKKIKKLLFGAPSCKLELARFSAQLKIQDGAECGNNLETMENIKELDKLNRRSYLALIGGE